MKTASDTRAALVLCLLAVVNYLLFYGLGIFLARTLGVEGFAKYSVAVAAVTMLASFATLGLEKLALRVIPTYVAQDNWGFASGFARFAVYTIVLVSWAAALVYFLFVRDTLDGVNPWFVLVLMTMLVPCMAVFLFLIEILSASGDAVAATLVYRLILPAGVVVLVGGVYLLSGHLESWSAVLCYALAWIFSLAVLVRLVRRSLPGQIWGGVDRYDSVKWLRSALPFLIQSVMMTQFASLGVVVLEFQHPGGFDVGLYAVSMQVSSLAVLLTTSTNRFYAPSVSMYLDRRDWRGLVALRKRRHRWIVPVMLVFVVVIVLFGREILSVYGPGFDQGYATLCILTLGITASVVFGMASYVLQFIDRAKWVVGSITVAGLFNLVLLLVLGKPFGATGAALAYVLSLGCVSLFLATLARHWAGRVVGQTPDVR